MITTSGSNNYGKIAGTRKCSPRKKLKRNYYILPNKYTFFTKQKSEVHKPEQKKINPTKTSPFVRIVAM